MKKISLSLAALAIINLHAQEIKLDPITISTTSFGNEQEITDVQASVQVLDKKVIESVSGRSVAQVIHEAVGLNVKDGGGSTKISMRGFSSDHTLIMVDGLRRTGKYGSSDVGGIALEDIERIEIVRGPMSALYGADAVGGVVNIITKEAGDKTSSKVSIIGGMAQNRDRKTGIARATINVGGEKVSHVISAEAKERGDYREDSNSVDTDLREESHKFLSYANTIKFGKDRLKTRLEFYDQDDSGVNEDRFGGPIDTFEEEKRYQFSGIYNHIGENYILDTNFGYGYSDTDVNRGAGSETTEYSQVEVNSYLSMFSLDDDIVNIIAVGARHEDIEVSMYTKDAYRTNFNALFQNEWSVTENLSTVIGIRYDDYSDFGSTTNPRISAKYSLDNLYFRAAYGEAFKAPSFTNMYGSFTRGRTLISGSPDLKPETSKTYEAALGYMSNAFTLDLVYHNTKFDDLINSYAVDARNTSYRNIDKATISGTELSLAYRLTEPLSIRASLEYLDTEDDTTGERLSDSARYTAKINLSYAQDDTNYFLNFKSMRDYYGAIEGTRPTQYEDIDYHVVDVKVTHAWSERLELYAGIDNIQNRKMDYGMTIFGLPNDPGERYYYVGVTAKF